MANLDYGKSLDWLPLFLRYDIDAIVALLQNYSHEWPTPLCNAYYAKLDSLLLYSFIRANRFTSILEIGGGISTNIMIHALNVNGVPARIENYSVDLRQDTTNRTGFVKAKFYTGDLLTTWYDKPVDVRDFDFVFIDAAHESYFATFYCWTILEHLSPGTFVHIHDLQEPDVLIDGVEQGYIKLGAFFPAPFITDEMYTLLHYLLNRNTYEVLCNSNNLIEKHAHRVAFIPDAEHGSYKHLKDTAPAEALWIRKK